MSFHVPERFRETDGLMGSDSSYGNNGVFLVFRLSKKPRRGLLLQCMASDGAGWEHVSVSLPTRAPTWEEMCFIKRMFWDDDDVVIQYHPASTDYVNNHPHCLHLWRPIGAAVPCPPSILVGFTDAEIRHG